MNVLIVDDDEIAIEMLKTVLMDLGHTVRCAADGREGLDVLAREECNAVISDWEMPVMNGIDFCKAVRGLGSAGYIYFILLTSHNSPAQRICGLSAGADDFIAKPFDPDELRARLQAAGRIVSMETHEVTIFAMAKLAESRDPETGGHLERVMNYSRALLQQLAAMEKFGDEIDPDFVRLVYGTSPLHDIGKVGIPDCVLLKPGRLSEGEFEIMRTHTTIGAQTLDAALRRFPQARFLRIARDIAASHHERIDGTGYPNRLKGDEIPLCARVVALADVYDALSSKRVYKDAFSHEIARAIITKDAGTHFAPEIVDAFLAAEDSFKKIRSRFRDNVSMQAAA